MRIVAPTGVGDDSEGWGEEGGRVNSGAMAGVQADQPRPEPGEHQKQARRKGQIRRHFGCKIRT